MMACERKRKGCLEVLKIDALIEQSGRKMWISLEKEVYVRPWRSAWRSAPGLVGALVVPLYTSLSPLYTTKPAAKGGDGTVSMRIKSE